MANKKKHDVAPEAEQAEETVVTPEVEETETPAEEVKPDNNEALAAAEDKFLRLAAEYDNYRKRTAKEKESLWTEAKAQTVAAFLPVYDNLERALKQETSDEAYKKGVELTMAELIKIFTSLGVEVFGEAGEAFDPNLHNAVMHIDDETLGENTIAQVFQKGAKIGDKVVRFAMVQVAN